MNGNDYDGAVSLCFDAQRIPLHLRRAMIELFCKWHDAERAESILETIPFSEWDGYRVGLIMKAHLLRRGTTAEERRLGTENCQ